MLLVQITFAASIQDLKAVRIFDKQPPVINIMAQTLPLRAFVHAALLPKSVPQAMFPRAASPGHPATSGSKRTISTLFARRTISAGMHSSAQDVSCLSPLPASHPFILDL